CVSLFEGVLRLALRRPRVLLRREVKKIKEKYRTLATESWVTADMLAHLEEIGESDPGEARILSEAGGGYWRLSCKDQPGDIVVERDRGKGETRVVATGIVAMCLQLFGAPLYKVAAELTAAALDCDVTDREVRQWCKDQPLKPSADKDGFFGALSALAKPR